MKKQTDSILKREQVIGTTTQILRRFDVAAATMYEAYHPSKKLASDTA
jgi:hypothetical protein